jgi:hypothetical protein
MGRNDNLVIPSERSDEESFRFALPMNHLGFSPEAGVGRPKTSQNFNAKSINRFFSQ